ncbi:hypothetical protein [Paenibacillus lutrae]|uniref:Uncharacterized protein n=1 Tax=Paenibacillus lutrae TaxID=2078573 RepID=A0A7X3JYU9_9BACL|nr:hypothetical protein [Paenibacillus lutrae]MVO99392.1 hypothetical protein [Paenibacillus lutrae]
MAENMTALSEQRMNLQVDYNACPHTADTESGASLIGMLSSGDRTDAGMIRSAENDYSSSDVISMDAECMNMLVERAADRLCGKLEAILKA